MGSLNTAVSTLRSALAGGAGAIANLQQTPTTNNRQTDAVCHSCQRPVHHARDCRAPGGGASSQPKHGKGKAKGKGKDGKGKGKGKKGKGKGKGEGKKGAMSFNAFDDGPTTDDAWGGTTWTDGGWNDDSSAAWNDETAWSNDAWGADASSHNEPEDQGVTRCDALFINALTE